MAESILHKIMWEKKAEVEMQKRLVPVNALKERAVKRQPRNFNEALRGGSIKLIAEVKKASPSKGVLNPNLKPVELAQTYEKCGAAAISVLTESRYFLGKLEYLEQIRKVVNVPLLRKDFISDEYQIYESAANGADAILLIVSMLEDDKLQALMDLSESLKLDCLVETHNEEELQRALLAGARIIGINNRDLTTFKVDTNTTRRLRMLIPPDVTVVSESGIKTKEDIKKMKECKVNAVLIGEALVTSKDIPSKIKEMLA